MPTTLKNILVIVAVLLSFSLSAQMLNYKIPRMGTIMQHFDNGSVHVTRVANDTFRLDSISPQGQQFELISFNVNNSGDWLFNYDYSPRFGLFTCEPSNEPSMCA
ncbi:MAG: hypothetical protein RI562_08920, partial [Salibacter sp.]|uniref:hypothetical protein n=1 Tax=Salibacter sp. TaxID=2010995 RepID=UPI002870AB92